MFSSGLHVHEHKAMEEYIVEALKLVYIHPSTSPSPQDGGLRSCNDYCLLKQVTMKYHYPLPLVLALLEQLKEVHIFTKFNLRSACNLICICECNDWKTAFSTNFGHYRYCVMLYGLSNAPYVFQMLINILHTLLGKFVIAYRMIF